jgi:DNA-directed RNA polymerase subunit beta'
VSESLIDPEDTFDHLRARVLAGIQDQLGAPIVGKKQSLHLEKLEVTDRLQPDDLRAQHKAKVENGTWSVPVHATVSLKNNDTGEVIDRRRIRIAEIPKTTSRHSYIIDGQEYQVDNQWLLRPGVYTRRRANGEIESQFNGGKQFDLVLDPASKVLRMEYGSSRGQLPVYPMLKTLGVSDEELEKVWGKEVLEANRKARNADTALAKFYKADKPWATDTPTHEAAAEHFYGAMEKFKLRPESTQLTLGKPFTHVTGEALKLATEKMLKVQSGHPEDDRDSLVFKDLRTAGDYAHDAIRNNGASIKMKTMRQVDKAKDVWDVLKFDMFNKPIKGALSSENSAARTATQINPLEMMSSAQQTTVMGSGGIKKVQSVTSEAKFVNPSHLGFLDPLNTPEGEKTGITLRLPIGVRKDGHEAKISLYNLLSKKPELVSPGEFSNANVVLPDQVEWKDGVPHPIHKLVRTCAKGNEIRDVPFDEAHYVLRHPSQLFNMTSNLIPFLGSTSGNRASMASRHMEQAVSLLHREAPLVQVDGPNSVMTFEQLMGQQASHAAPVDGKVTEVKKDAILIEGHDGAKHEVQLYDNYPLNDTKGVMHSTPLSFIKPGAVVKRGQTIADTNFSKDGTLALGTNLRVAYLPFKGYNFEDGIVISDSAAEKLSSEHLHKPNLPLDADVVLDKRRFHLSHPGAVSKEQYTKLGTDGVVRVGQRVQPGDPLIVAMKPFKLKDRTGLSAIRRSLSGEHTDKSLRWDSDFEGEVVGVHRNPKGVSVHVRTVEPMQVGDKLCFDARTEVLTTSGWKTISAVTTEDNVCCLDGERIVYQAPTAVHAYANGGRMYHLESQQVDLLVTEHHRMLVKERGKKDFTLRAAADIAGRRVRYKKSGEWDGPPMPEVVLPAMQIKAGQGGRGIAWLPEQRIAGRTYLMLLGMFLSEGNLLDINSTYGIQFTQTKPAGVAQLLAALDSSGVRYTHSGEKITLYSKQLLEHFRQFGGAKEKFIPAYIFEHSRADLLLLFHWLMWGDGHRLHAEPDGRPVTYTSTSKQLIDDVQRLCLHIGYAANIKIRPEHWWEQNGRKYLAPTCYKAQIVTTKLTPQVNHGHVKTQHGQRESWIDDYDGPVYCVTVPTHVLYVRRNGKPVWSGNSNRFGGKGIVTLILPNKEMPHTPDGKHIEVALNPSGVPGRMNVGQLLETAAGKVAQKTGKPYIVKNFGTHSDALADVQADLRKHGLHDAEFLKDPGTGQELGKVMVGPQHMFKLVHQVEKKLSVRSGSGGMPGSGPAEGYDLNLQPMGGKSTGGQSMGTLGLFALLAHGAKHNIREMQSYKSEGPDPQTDPAKRWPSDHHRIWAAIQTGQPLPPPKPTFAFRKFEDMIRGTGVNIDKKGHDLILSPMTNDQIIALAKHALPHPADMLMSKVDKNGEQRPKPGGLWDEKLTGGIGGRQWTRIELAEPIPNPIFEKPIKVLTGLSSPKDYDAIVQGKKGVTPNGNITDASAGVTGGAGIELLLKRIDVKRDLAKAEATLKTAKGGQGVDKALKRVKYLRALDQLGVKPHEAYILHNVPIVPPIMRPVSTMSDGTPKFDDLNQLYSDFAKINDKLKDPVWSHNMTDEGKAELRASYYDGVKAFMGLGMDYKLAKHKGLLHKIVGPQPKNGFFQDKLVSRKQDLTMRSTIVPEPALDLDEVGLPKHAALELFKPFVVRKLKDMGAIPDEMAGAAYVEKKNASVWRALDKVMAERPLLLKRDPALHKYNVQAFTARAIDGNAVRIHPLVTGGYNADFDGDTMSAFVPITREALKEAEGMKPSHNLFSEATGRLMYQPTLDSALGLYKLSVVGKDSHKKFEHPGAALESVRAGATHYTDIVHVGGKATTAGRILLASAVPEDMEHHILHDLAYRIDGKGLSALLTGIAKKHTPQYGEIINKLKDLGNGAAFGAPMVAHAANVGHTLAFGTHEGTPIATQNNKKNTFVPIGAHSLTLDDFTPDVALREHILNPVRKAVADIYDNPKLHRDEQDRRAIALYEGAASEMKTQHEKKQDKDPSNLFTMYRAGVKPGWEQYKQMVLAPMIYKDSADRKIPTPVTKSYAEGFDIGSYWTQMHGARRGSVMKVQETSGPGYLSKMLMSNMMHILVNSPDCGTDKGVLLDVNEPDIHDRYLQQDFTHGKLHITAGTLLSPDIIGQIRAARKDAKLLVRSPLKCEDEKGICQKCVGYSSSGQHYDLGHNIGVQSAQAVGERGIQLALKAFHTGGISESKGGSKLLNSFERFNQLMELHKHIPDEASLAMRTGKVEKMVASATGMDIYIGGVKHHVGRDAGGLALHHSLPGAEAVEGYVQWKAPAVGVHFDAGEHLSDPNRSILNPHQLYEATGSMEKVQNHLTNEIYDLYKDEGIKRRAIETVVRAMSNLSKIEDPGDHPDVLRGEFRPTSTVYRMNQELLRDKKRPIEHTPVIKGVHAMPLALQEDWMAKMQHERLAQTFLDAAATSGVSHIHGTHPIPSIAYGAEVGLTVRDSLKPGQEHLKNVPAHWY